MADNLNIKNPSVTQGELDLRTDASGNIVSISGHSIAGGAGGGNVYFGDDEYIKFKTGTTNTFTLTDGVKDVIEHIPQTVETEVNRISYTKDSIDDKLDEKQNKLTFEYDEDNKVSAINGSALAGQGGTTYTPGQYINIDSNNEISVTGVVASDEYATYSGDWNDVSNSYKTNSGSFLTNEDLTNYYTKTQTSSDSQLSTEFAKYATTTYVDGKDPVLIGDSNITAASSTVDGHTQWNLAVNATPVVTDTKLVGDNCVTAHTTTNSGEWIVGLEQTAYEAIDSIDDISNDVTTLKNASANWNKVSDKLDTTAFSTVSGNFLTAHQSLDDYATKSDINDMATQTWVGQQGFYTKASGDNDYAPKSVTATINTLTGASAGWNNVTAKLDKSIYSNASGNWEASYNVLTAYSAAGTWLTAHQSLTNYYTKSETSGASELSDEFAKYVTSSNVSTQDANYVMTTTGWKVLTLPGGGMTQVYHDTTLTGQGNANDNKLSVAWSALSGNTINSALSAGSATSALSAEDALSSRYAKQLQDASKTIQISDVTALQNWASSNSSTWNEVSAKLGTAQYAIDSATFVTKPDTTQTVLNNNYLIYSTLTGEGTTTGWMPLSANYYSKSETNGTFVATANIDSTTLSGDGKSVSTKLGVKTDVIATRDYVNSSFLPTSGGTVSGTTIISGSSFETLEVLRSGQTCTGTIGINGVGGMSLKIADSNSNNTQLNIDPTATMDKRFSIGDTPHQPVAYFIPAVTSTTTAGLTNDGILHIIVES